MSHAYVQVNKFEQVSTTDHQMSLAGWSIYGGEGGRPGLADGVRPCTGGPSSSSHVDRQTHIKTVPSRNFFGGR